MILVDTNILIYAVNRDSACSTQASGALESIANDPSPWALAWSIIYEFLRVATHPKVFPRPLDCETAWKFASELFTQPGCIMLTETVVHRETVDQCLEEIPRIRGNLLHDFRLAVLMREHGIKKILTEDRDFRMFPWVEVESLADT